MTNVYVDRVRTARLYHFCVECSIKIEVGTKYVYASGIWDGNPWSAKFCTRCDAVRKQAWIYVRHDPDECPPIGELARWLSDEFQSALRAIDGDDWAEKTITTGGPILTDLLANGKRS
jgi:hypothetical protein